VQERALNRFAHFHAEIEELGYRRFAVRASDLGTGIALRFGLACPDSVIGLHLNGANPRAGAIPLQGLTEAEKEYLADVESFWAREGAYAMMHSTKAADAGLRVERFASRARRLDRGEVQGLERLQRRRREELHQR